MTPRPDRVSQVKSVLTRDGAAGPTRPAEPGRRWPGARLLAAGTAAFAAAIALYAIYAAIHPLHWTLEPVDLGVYRSGGLIVRHIQPTFDPHLRYPLYDWGGYGSLGLKFTYTPFAAIVFAVVSFIPWSVLPNLSIGFNIVFLVAALWCTFGGLGYRSRPWVRLGATLLATAAVFWTEPVIRTLYLGQVNLALMALIIWDLCQPDTRRSRWWKGAGVGIAAGIKLVPLVFIPYLLLARKFRQAAAATIGFACTVLVGFLIQGNDSATWWFHGLFFQGGRTGFTGWEGNQSLRGLITRLAGSITGGQTAWILAAVLAGIAGVACAAILDRSGHQVAGLLAAALTGLLLSPISWDHHWVWTAPAVAMAGHYAVRSWRTARARALAWWGLAAAILAVYGAWPGSLWGEPTDLGAFSLGILWQPPNTDPSVYYKGGDQPWFVEYHWHGLQLITGNAFILGGLALFVVLIAATARVALRARATRPYADPAASGQAPAGAGQAPAGAAQTRPAAGRPRPGMGRRARIPPTPGHAPGRYAPVIGDVSGLLTCPVCGRGFPLPPAAGPPPAALRCANGHSFDVARQGYVNLLPGGARPGTADTAEMVTAREAFLSAGHYAPLADGVAALAAAAWPRAAAPPSTVGPPSTVPFGSTISAITTSAPGAQTPAGAVIPPATRPCVLDAGAGPGYYLAAVLDEIRGRPGGADAAGLAMDISARALRRAARARPGIGAVVWDIWRPFPVRDGAVSLILNVFAPRNGPEFRRVLRDDGGLIVVTPGPRHLAGLAGLAAGPACWPSTRARRSGSGPRSARTSPWRTRAT